MEYMKILYVEDDKIIREGMSRFLERRFENVFYAINGQKGLEKFIEIKPDIVITDIQMPVMTGLEMSMEIKVLSPNTPIIATTAFSESQYLLKAIEIGIDRYILKPIDKKKLFTVLDDFILLHKRQMEIVEKNAIIDYILSNNPCFTVMANGDKIKQTNKFMLEFLGYSLGYKFIDNNHSINELPIISKNNENNWYEQLQNPANKNVLVNILGCTEETLNPMYARLNKFPVSGINLITFSRKDESEEC